MKIDNLFDSRVLSSMRSNVSCGNCPMVQQPTKRINTALARMKAWAPRNPTVQTVGQEIHRKRMLRFDHSKFESGKTPLKQPRKSKILCGNVNSCIFSRALPNAEYTQLPSCATQHGLEFCYCQWSQEALQRPIHCHRHKLHRQWCLTFFWFQMKCNIQWGHLSCIFKPTFSNFVISFGPCRQYLI
jgi:hypothetical protein